MKRCGARWPGSLPRLALVGTVLAAVCLSACAPSGVVKEPAAVAPRGPRIATRTVVASQVQPGPPSARQQETTTVSCPAGSTLVSGGAQAYLADGKAPNPSLRLVGTEPGRGEPLTKWQSVVATGGVNQDGSQVSAVGVCGQGMAATTVKVVDVAAPGPTAAASDALATATCPQGSVLVGGGAAVSLTDGQPGPPQYFFTASFPSAANGAPAVSGPVPNSWTAIGALGGMPMTNGQVRAIADCVPGSSTSVTVVVSTFLGPTAAMSAKQVTASCPAHSVLVGGGVYAGPSELHHTLQGLHLRGSFPTGPLGAPVASGAAPTSWSVIANAGGILAVGARTTAFALCAAS
jgi:hypothetical protein